MHFQAETLHLIDAYKQKKEVYKKNNAILDISIFLPATEAFRKRMN